MKMTIPTKKKKPDNVASPVDPLDLWPAPKMPAKKKPTNRVSAAEKKQKPVKKSPWAWQDMKKLTQDRIAKAKAKEDAKKPFLFAVVEEWVDALVWRFPSVNRTKIAWVVFENLPECEAITTVSFSIEYKISIQSLHRWRVDDEFEEVRKYFIRRFLVQDTSKVLANLAKGAQFSWPFWPNIAAVKLFLQYAEEWSERMELDHDVKGGFSVNFGAAASPFTQGAAEVPVTKTKTPEKLTPQEETVQEPAQDDQEHQDNDAAAQ